MTQRRPTSQDGAAGARSDQHGLFTQISQALDRIHQLYQEIEALSRSQEELIERDEGDELLEVLARRQVLIVHLGDLDRVLVPLRERWEQGASQASDTQRAHVHERLAAIADLAVWIAHRDGDTTQKLKRRRDALAEELAGLSRSRSARTAYGPAASDDGPRFQDREG